MGDRGGAGGWVSVNANVSSYSDVRQSQSPLPNLNSHSYISSSNVLPFDPEYVPAMQAVQTEAPAKCVPECISGSGKPAPQPLPPSLPLTPYLSPSPSRPPARLPIRPPSLLPTLPSPSNHTPSSLLHSLSPCILSPSIANSKSRDQECWLPGS